MLAAPHAYNITGTLTEEESLIRGVFAVSVLELIDDTNSTIPFAFEGTNFNQNGILGAGQYHLIVSSVVGHENPLEGSEFARGTFDFTLTLSAVAVPEPGSLTLACVGLVAMVLACMIRTRRNISVGSA